VFKRCDFFSVNGGSCCPVQGLLPVAPSSSPSSRPLPLTTPHPASLRHPHPLPGPAEQDTPDVRPPSARFPPSPAVAPPATGPSTPAGAGGAVSGRAGAGVDASGAGGSTDGAFYVMATGQIESAEVCARHFEFPVEGLLS
jgi:hypothetical protein